MTPTRIHIITCALIFLFIITTTYNTNFKVLETYIDWYFISFIGAISIINIKWLLFWEYRNLFIAYVLVYSVVGGILASTILYDIILLLTYNIVFKFLLVLVPIIALAMFIYFFDKKGKYIRLFLLFFVIFNGFSIFQKASKTNDKTAQQQLQTFYNNLQINNNFIYKHNVYYLIYDTYPSFEKLNIMDKFKNKAMYNFLNDNKFSIQKSAFSNYNNTYSQMWATFHMQLGIKNDKINHEFGIDSVYKGKNIVAKTFSQNGYNIYIHSLENNVSYKNTKIRHIKHINAFNVFIYMIHANKLQQKIYQILNIKKEIAPPYSYNKLKNFNNTLSPKFVYLHSPVVHRDIDMCFNTLGQNYSDRKIYYKQIKCANKDIQKTVNYITKNDPNAIIILQADHGQTIYGLQDSQETYFTFAKRQGINFSGSTTDKQKQVTLAEYGILFAIKWPNECAYLGNEKYTPVNLFPRVFACLSGTKPDYKNMQPNISLRTNKTTNSKTTYKVIDNFKLLDKPQIITKP